MDQRTNLHAGCILLVCILCCSTFAYSDIVHEKLLSHGSACAVYVPKKRSPNKQYPILIYLHGTQSFAATKTDIAKRFAILEKKSYPMIAIAPYLPESNAGSYLGRSWGMTAVEFEDRRHYFLLQLPLILDCLDIVAEKYPANRDEIYLSGYSSGGGAVFALGMFDPKVATRVFPEYQAQLKRWTKVRGIIALLAPKYQEINDFLRYNDVEKYRSIPIYFLHHRNDGLVTFKDTTKVYHMLLEAGFLVNRRVKNGRHFSKPEDIYFALKSFEKIKDWFLCYSLLSKGDSRFIQLYQRVLQNNPHNKEVKKQAQKIFTKTFVERSSKLFGKNSEFNGVLDSKQSNMAKIGQELLKVSNNSRLRKDVSGWLQKFEKTLLTEIKDGINQQKWPIVEKNIRVFLDISQDKKRRKFLQREQELIQLYRKARKLEKKKDYLQALAIYQKMSSARRSFCFPLAKARWLKYKKSKKMSVWIQVLNQEKEAFKLYKEAKNYEKEGFVKEAQDLYQKILKDYPKTPTAQKLNN